MNLKLIKSAVLITLGAASIWVVSCKKETKPTENAVSETQEFTAFEEGEQLALKIKNFENSLEQAKQGKTNNEAIALEEALENMELLINASHGFPFEAYGQRTNQTINFQLVPNAEGKVRMEAVAAAYDQMKAQIKEVYENTNFEEKGLIVVTLKVDEEAKGGSTIEADIAIGDKDKNNPFDECWYYGELEGTCDNQFVNESDGAEEICSAVAANNPIIGYNDRPGDNYRLITENQTEIHLDGHEYLDDNQEYIIFHYPDLDGNNMFTEEERQLSIDEMNYYYNNEMSLIYNILIDPSEYNYPFPDYCLIAMDLEGNPYLHNNKLHLRHEHFITYAKRYWVEKGIIPDPTPIDS